MASQSPRHSTPARPPCRRAAPSVRLRCEQFEDRITPANLFNVQTPYQLGGSNNGFVGVTDLNHDGLPDAIMTDEGLDFDLSAGNKITILKGLPGGGFSASQINTGGTNVSFAAIADINGDGYDDVVATNENNGGTHTGSVSVFQNDGLGHLFLVGSPFSSLSINPSWVGLADVTGDGVKDVVVGAFGNDDGTGNNVVGNGITIFQGGADQATGRGNFSFTYINTLSPSVAFIPTALALADFDGDGKTDIAAAYPGVPADSTQPQPHGFVDLWRGTGLGAFTEVTAIDSGGALPVNIQAADLNGDGKKDLIVANAGDPNSTSPFWAGTSVGVLLNFSQQGQLVFDGPTQLLANAYGAFAVAVADYNLDGKQDIAAINFGDIGTAFGGAPAKVAVYQGVGDGTFTVPTPPTPATYTVDSSAGNAGGQYLAVGDFDRNGTPDLIVAMAANRVGLLLNATAPPAKVTSVQVADGSAQRSAVRTMTVTFSGPVTFAGGNANAAAAFQLARTGPSGPTGNVGLTATVTTDAQGRTVVTLKFSGPFAETGTAAGVNPSLVDGIYALTILGSAVTGANGLALDGDGNGTPGGNYALSTHRLFGDSDGDGDVDLSDLTAFGGALFSVQPGPAYNPAFDFDGDGDVDLADLTAFGNRLFLTGYVP